jgi:protein-L-isoaspartate(D-aspartate) O-methyltransferase
MVTDQLVAGGIQDQRVLEAMGKVPRHEFVSPGMEPQAYFDRPLPIGDGQTISQPLMVAIMTEAMKLKGHERVLEIGTGSGYQAAVLAELAKEVFTIERLESLSVRARRSLYKVGYQNVQLKVGDGTLGWPEEAPYDGIMVTAGAPKVPDHLKHQLADGGRLVVPVGGTEFQQLIIVERDGNNFHTTLGSGCRFVRLIGENGWQNE